MWVIAINMDIFECIWIHVNLCELIWIYVWIVWLSGNAALCGRTSGSVWQCAQRQIATVRLVVYGSVHGSVRLSGSAAVCRSVRQYRLGCSCATVHAAVCVAVCRPVCGSKHRSAHTMRTARAAVCSSAIDWQCAPVCGSLWQCQCTAGSKCVAVRIIYIYTKLLTIYIPSQAQWEWA
jgi:hypothetical protein